MLIGTSSRATCVCHGSHLAPWGHRTFASDASVGAICGKYGIKLPRLLAAMARTVKEADCAANWLRTRAAFGIVDQAGKEARFEKRGYGKIILRD